MRYSSVASLVVLILAPILHAQPLADRVPADAIAFIGWKGTANLGPAYDGSHSRAVIDASALPELFTQFVPDLIRKVRTKNPDGADAMELLASLGAAMWKHPSAVYFGGVDLADPKKPQPRLALLCAAGDQTPRLVAGLNEIIAELDDLPFPLTAKADGELLIVSTFPLAANPDSSLARRAEFVAGFAQVEPKEALFTMYVDGEGTLQLIDALVNAEGDVETIKNWPRARAAMGLDGLKRAVWSGGFDGADWGWRVFVEAPAPRKGVLTLLEAAPLPDDFLKVIPKSTTLLAAGGLDLSRALAEIRAGVKMMGDEASANLEKGLSVGSMMLGANIEKDLIDALGPHWGMYMSPSVGGNGLLGLTVVNRLDDPARAQRTLGLLETLANNMIATQMHQQKDGPRIAFRQAKTDDGKNVHFLAVPFVAPAWVVHGQNLFVAPFPQVVASAAAQGEAKESILDNETFVKMRARLGGERAGGVQFLDLPKVGADGYGGVLMMAQIGLGMADMLGVPAPAMVLPRLDQLQPHFTPMFSVARSDERGFYYRQVLPFPGADYFGPQNQAFVGQQAMLISVLLPSLSRARETANRVKCATNLRQIGMAMLLHSNENDSNYPATMGELLKQDITIDIFTCPSSSNDVPPEVKAAALEVQMAWVNDNSSYVYAGAGKKNTAPADQVVVYEHLHNHDGDGINMLYADGHVEFQMRQTAVQLLRQQGHDVDEGAFRDDAEAMADIATQAFYSVDDGKTWFADDVNKVPPFDHNGKPAYRVYVYKCADEKPFVSHLERYTPEGKKAMEAAMKADDGGNPVIMEDVMLTGLEVKEPGTDPVKGWVKQSDAARAAKIMELKCADGTTDSIVPVVPE